MTIECFREDAYLKSCNAKVTELTELGGVVLDQTVFYPTGGGQPGDCGELRFDGNVLKIATTVYDKSSGELVHVPKANQTLPQVGQSVEAAIDWDKRYLHMRMHTALHLLCSAIPCGVTGGQIGADKSRLDFDIGEHTLDKEAITESLNQLVNQSEAVTFEWITDKQLDQNPELVRTMSVQPPRGAGKIRLIKVGDKTDIQPCGGTHVANTSEIGPIMVKKIENKGKRNRRVHIVFAE